MDFLLSFILGAVILFYLLGAFGKILLRWFIKRNFGKFTQFTSQSASSGQREQQQSRHEGDVFISNNGQTSKKVRSDIGDYVEFEEIKGE